MTEGPRHIGDVTEDLAPYLRRAQEIAETLPEGDGADGGAKAGEDLTAARIERWVARFGVPYRHARVIAEGAAREGRALSLYRRWREVAPPGSILAASAPYGHGKTLMAAQAVIDGPPQPYPMGKRWPDRMAPAFITASDLGFMSPYDDERFGRLLEASVLAVDDVGVEYLDPKGFLKVKLNHLLLKREASCGWTILTTNLSCDEFVARFDAHRFMARLQGRGCSWQDVTDENYRLSR